MRIVREMERSCSSCRMRYRLPRDAIVVQFFINHFFAVIEKLEIDYFFVARQTLLLPPLCAGGVARFET